MNSLINIGVFFVLLTNGALGRFLPEAIFRNTSNRDGNGERADDCNCEWRFYQHYEVKGCQIIQRDSCGCPTSYLCSSAKQSEPQSKVCSYQSLEYKVGEKIKLADNCQVCRCVDGIPPRVVCRHRECPQLEPVEGENCHLVYEENKCCPSRYECTRNASGDTAETSAFACVHNNITYPLGAKIFPPDDPCLICECKKDWIGIDNSSCHQQECVFERKKHLLDAGCIPIYHERKCCPIEYYCPEDLRYNNLALRELEKENSTEDAGGNCIFGGNSFDIGAELSLNKSCVKCSCQVPPDFTCVHQSCSLPPSSENCVEVRSADQCCPTYDCVLTDSTITETAEMEERDSEPSTTKDPCPTPMCADDSCRIEIPPGHECPTCVCGDSRETNEFEPLESPFEPSHIENSNQTQTESAANETLSTTDDSENELLSMVFDEKMAQQISNLENLEEIEPELELQTGESIFPEKDEYFTQFQSGEAERVENHLVPEEIRQKRSLNMQTAEIQAQQTQQQWNVMDEDEMETSETVERERELSDESSEGGFDEIKAFGSRTHNKPSAGTIQLDDRDFNSVVWRSSVAGCPTPLCADSSCRIGIPQGHQCPTCICKKSREP